MAFQNNLDLHEAMVLLLLERKYGTGVGKASANDLSAEIWRRRLYKQDGGRMANGSIIVSRAIRYAGLFTRDGSGGSAVISLRDLPRVHAGRPVGRPRKTVGG